ncbi:MAG: hypothetical protein J6T70_05040, partial [Bacteroidales bacterium]|nr:hypothetical protein [Bacteroidales bacterium]
MNQTVKKCKAWRGRFFISAILTILFAFSTMSAFAESENYPYALLEDGTLTFYYTESKPADALEYNTVYSPWQFN